MSSPMDMQFFEDDKYYYIRNFETDQFFEDASIDFNFKDSDNNIFSSTGDGLKFKKFFILEFYKIVQELLDATHILTPWNIVMDLKRGLLEHGWINKFNIKKLNIEFDKSKLEEFNLEFRPYQNRFFNFYSKTYRESSYRGLILAAGVGAGKTAMSLGVMECRMVDTVIVVTPKNALHDVWVRSISGYKDLELGIDYPSIYKNPRKSWNSVDDIWCGTTNFPTDCKYFIFHYEAVDRINELLEKRDCGRIGFLLDESHHFNEEDSDRSAAFIDAVGNSKSEDVIWLSATPIKAKSVEMIQMLKTLDANFDEEVSNRFRKIFEDVRGKKLASHRFETMSFLVGREEYMDTPPPIETTVYVKPKVNIEVTDGRSQRLFDLKSNKYVLTHISKRSLIYNTHRTKFLNNSENKHIKTYRQMLATFKENCVITEEEKKDFENYLSAINKLRIGSTYKAKKSDLKFCSQYEKNILNDILSRKGLLVKTKENKDLRDAEVNRFDFYIDVIRNVKSRSIRKAKGSFYMGLRKKCFVNLAELVDLLPFIKGNENKVVIFAEHVETIDTVVAKLEKAGIKFMKAHGEALKKIPLKTVLHEFRTNDDVRGVAATYKTMGSSLGLTEADTVILLDPSFRDYIKIQAVGRADRPGQKNRVKVINVILDTGDELNLSVRTLDINKETKKNVEEIIGRNLFLTEMDLTPILQE